MNHDFERELDHLKQVLERQQSSEIGQKIQQTAEYAARKAEQAVNNMGEKAKQYMNQQQSGYQRTSSTGYQTASGQTRPPQQNWQQPKPPVPPTPPAQPKPPARRQTKIQPHNKAWLAKQGSIPGQTASTLFKVFGLIGAIPMVPTALIGTAIMALSATPEYIMASFVGWSAPVAAFFTAMTMLGFGIGKKVKRCNQYRRFFENNKMMTLDQLSTATQRSKKYLRRDIKKMIRNGGLIDVYFDAQETCVILDNETYHQYLQLENRRKTFELSQPGDNTVTESRSAIRTQGEKYIRQIRAANDALPGQEISDKLFRLEAITIKLYEQIEKHPEKLDQLQKFMDYYMPTTTKLVTAYQEFDAQPVQGSNIQSAKQEIENMFDTISTAFEKLLDEMFAEKVMDISSDISVMETMFKQDGLTEDEITSTK